MQQAPGAPHDQRRLPLLAMAWLVLPMLLLSKLWLHVLLLPEPLACCRLDHAPT